MMSMPVLDRFRRQRRDREARGWIARIDTRPMTAADDRAFAAWIARPGAEAAFRRAAALWNEIDQAVLAQRLEAAKIARWKPRPRPPVKSIAFAAAASILLIATFAPRLWIILSADVRTGPFETRKIALDDGSEIELGSNSAVDVAYSRGQRRVRLLEGEAAFRVAPDRARPFVVGAAGGETRALGTEFLVSWRDGGITVTGLVHHVRVSTSATHRDLGPGEAVHYGRFATPEAQRADPHAGDWRRGLYVAENKPLAEIAAALERYADRSILVLGSARSRTFSGVFRTSDPVAGLKTAANIAKLQITEMPGVVIVTAR
jgi:transmembrane sensor